jgi:hypothetical protein
MSEPLAVNETEICIGDANDKERLAGLLRGERAICAVTRWLDRSRDCLQRHKLPIIASSRNRFIVCRWDRGDNPFRAHYIRNSISLTMTRSHRII